MLSKRLLSSALFVPLLLLAFMSRCIGAHLLFLILTIAIWWGLHEVYGMLSRLNFTPQRQLGVLAGVLLSVSGYFHLLGYNSLPFFAGIICVFFILTFILEFNSEFRRAISSIMATMFGFSYVAMPLVIIYFLRAKPNGLGYLLFVFAVTWTGDAGGYFIGKKWGKEKLAYRLSPKKTVEGAAGNVIVSIIFVFIIGWIYQFITSLSSHSDTMFFWKEPSLRNYLFYFCISILFSVVGQAGDLAESLLKRAAGIKDSGPDYTGHGGILDIIDALLFALPVVYVFSMF